MAMDRLRQNMLLGRHFQCSGRKRSTMLRPGVEVFIKAPFSNSTLVRLLITPTNTTLLSGTRISTTRLGTWFQVLEAIMGSQLQLLTTPECRAPLQINAPVVTIARKAAETIFNRTASALTWLRIPGPEVQGNSPAATSTTAGFTLR
jgi:hypothetical protein